MRFSFIVGILVLSVFNLKAQSPEKVLNGSSKTYDQFFEMDAAYEIGGGSVNNAMLNRFLFGGFIDEATKTSNSDRLNKLNYAGQSARLRLSYRQENRKIFNREFLGYQINLEWNNMAQIRFTPDLFQTIFYGNSAFTGDFASLSQTSFYYLNYYSIGGGLNGYFNSKKHFFLVNIQLNLGNSYQKLNLSDAHLFTSEQADSLSFEGIINYDYLKTDQYNFGQIHGYGAGIDFLYRYENQKNTLLEFRLDDFGFIYWPKKMRTLDYDKPIIWEGMEVSNILQMPDSLFSTNFNDTVNDFLSQNSSVGPKTIFTNFSIQARYRRNLMPKKLDIEAVVNYWFTGYLYGEHQVKLHYTVSPSFSITPSIGYGRYSRFNFGLGFKFQQKNGNAVSIGTNYLSGIILQQKFAGLGGFINFTKQI